VGAVRAWAGAPRPPSWAAEEGPAAQDSAALAHWIYQERRARLIVKPDGEVIWISAAGRALMASDGPITLEQGALTGATQHISQRLQSLLRAPSANAPCWLLEEDGLLVWAQHIARPAPATVGLTMRRVGEELEVSALAEARQLTPAEARIMGMMLSGAEAGRIAQALDISVETLRTHVKHVYTKLGVNSRGAMFALAFHFAQP
jgi:DNA-binding CsgD family transcriptional regulator